MQWLCSQLCHVTAANQWTVVEIELLGWKWGCQPFSCPCSKNVIHCGKEICSTCLSKESMPFNNFLQSRPPLPTRSLSSRERQYVPPALHYIMVASCPSLCCSCRKKTCLMLRSRGFGHGVVVSKICYNAVIVLSVVLCDCCKPMNNCRDWAFSNSGLEVGLPAFQLPMFANVTHCRKEICSTCLSKESMPFDPFVKSKPPLPTRSLRFLRAAARSTSCALCLLYACKRSHPFVEDSGFVSYAEKHRFGHGVVVSKVCYRILECVFFSTCHVDYRNVSGLSY